MKPFQIFPYQTAQPGFTSRQEPGLPLQQMTKQETFLFHARQLTEHAKELIDTQNNRSKALRIKELRLIITMLDRQLRDIEDRQLSDEISERKKLAENIEIRAE